MSYALTKFICCKSTNEQLNKSVKCKGKYFPPKSDFWICKKYIYIFLFLAFQLCIFAGPEFFVQNSESCYSYTRLFRAYILGMKMQFRGKEETEKNVKVEELEKSEWRHVREKKGTVA